MLNNTQPITKQILEPGGILMVHSIWDTIQGEGPFAGLPAVFIRLSDCNLQCRLCDTDYTSIREPLHPVQILQRVLALKRKLVVLTGGEPFRQNITPLVERLSNNNIRVQIETNGTLALDKFPYLETCIVLSPKTPAVHKTIAQTAAVWKYVLQSGHVCGLDGLPTSVLGMDIRPARAIKEISNECIYVQPLDEQDYAKNRQNATAAAESCLKFGYRFSFQLHKLVGLA